MVETDSFVLSESRCISPRRHLASSTFCLVLPPLPSSSSPSARSSSSAYRPFSHSSSSRHSSPPRLRAGVSRGNKSQSGVEAVRWGCILRRESSKVVSSVLQSSEMADGKVSSMSTTESDLLTEFTSSINSLAREYRLPHHVRQITDTWGASESGLRTLHRLERRCWIRICQIYRSDSGVWDDAATWKEVDLGSQRLVSRIRRCELSSIDGFDAGRHSNIYSSRRMLPPPRLE